MIEEQFVSFDTAKLLKEAGFREHCRCMYFPEKKGGYKICQNLIGDYDVTNDVTYEKNLHVDCYLAPTQALAARWLRDVHHLNVYACFDYVCFDDGERKWFFMRENTMINDYTSVYCSIISYDIYEQALEAGLQEAIKLIKEL